MKKLLLQFSLLLSLGLNGQWVQQSDVSGSKRFAAVDFTVGGQVYILGGIIQNVSTYSAFDNLWMYDPQNDSWAQMSPYPGGKIYAGISFIVNDTVYVGLGANENGVQNNQLWAYDWQNDQWTQKANFPGNVRNFAFSFSSDNKGFVGAGVNFTGGLNNLNDFWQYDPSTDSWMQLANYPGGGRVGMTAMTIDDKGFVGMGDDGSFFYTDFYQYDIDISAWVPVTAFPGNNRSFYATTSVDGKGYLMGGESINGGYTNEMWSYDPSDGTWTAALDFTGTSRAYGNLFYVNNAFYYGLGLIGPNDDQGSKELWKYQLSGFSLDYSERSDISVYPNPTTGKVQLDLVKNYNKIEVELVNLLGEKLNAYTFEQTDKITLELVVPRGVYFLRIKTKDYEESVRLLKS